MAAFIRQPPAQGWRSRGTVFIAALAAIGATQFMGLPRPAARAPFAELTKGVGVGATLNAFGVSQEVRLRFTLPSAELEFPLEVTGDPSTLTYEWVKLGDSTATGYARPLSGSSFVAPGTPGFYHLAIVRGVQREVLPEPTLAVMVPFEQKVAGRLNGYRIGTYLAERLGRRDHPEGFIQVRAEDSSLMVSKHLRLGDFLTHDGQEDVWPKYVALNPRLLDKLELVLAKVGQHAHVAATAGVQREVAFDVHSGFRTPAHNNGVWRAASDSRHEHGDAADVAIDADGDGRVTMKDERLVERAVEQVEEEHPDLVGGLGLYTSAYYHTPYVHIDARGRRSRWTG
jgi:uncharacterized protein YcbK (DUF882 family)